MEPNPLLCLPVESKGKEHKEKKLFHVMMNANNKKRPSVFSCCQKRNSRVRASLDSGEKEILIEVIIKERDWMMLEKISKDDHDDNDKDPCRGKLCCVFSYRSCRLRH